MRRPVRVAAGLAVSVTASLVFASVSSAEDVTVPGCFGAGPAIVCDVTAEVHSPLAVGTTEIVVPVCVGTCTDVPVRIVQAVVTWPGEVCVSYSDRNGVEQERLCRTIEPQPVPTVSVPPLPRPTATVPPLPRPTATVPPLPTVNTSAVVATASREASEAASLAVREVQDLGETLQPIFERIVEIFEEGCDIERRPICG